MAELLEFFPATSIYFGSGSRPPEDLHTFFFASICPLHLSQTKTVNDSLLVSLVCPVCQKKVQTDALRLETVEKLLGVITLNVVKETVLKCPKCSSTMITKADLPELESLSADQLGQKFSVRVGGIPKLLIILSWLVFFTGPVSFFISLTSIFFVPKSAKGWRYAALGSMVLSVVFVAVLFHFMSEFKR